MNYLTTVTWTLLDSLEFNFGQRQQKFHHK